ncbi:WD40 repeat-like protein [Dothidotthia symphoricarpi CBS 119687]|uniref:WD40 repeat-like protein n=1 Tax=Dothidotthia symphoricarpi CBS 119687 TaxID=1392245 RepID=A0A6A6AHG8_9PLEO|nr:WD40 repeat-like protein [Dothidotthia symphoricarpi CBS 119687]KAF2130535.1 WD40 repeat-like protein [Dothidotthia symphoricarpi CBS 119687]
MAGPPHFSPPPYMHPFRPASAMSANRFDEGYSEDTRSQSGSDTLMRTDVRLDDAGMDTDPSALPDWVKALSESERSEFAYAILRSLRTSSVASIVEKLNPLLHLDPVLHLPPEITFQILSYLDPETLLRASILSRAWRYRVLDGPLWKLLFRLEGWNSNFSRVHSYENAEKQKRIESREKERKTRPRAAEDMDRDKLPSKKRVRERQLFGQGPARQNSIHDELKPLSLSSSVQGHTPWGEQHGLVEADDGSSRTEDRMEGVSFHDLSPTATPTRREARAPAQIELASPTSASADSIRPALLLPGPEPKVNWQFLYKQKRRLEENWDAGRFSNFQLPHPNHPDEAHTECVYTIQYSGNFLVSGSRDKTIRIWNLDTLRLVHPPLVGHSASVLCLQFDERPGQDIVVSGGSDCRVILWQFSTGRIIKEIEKAHSESVLNLRFDDRYLVTCSKDKTIKVWNRKEMCPTDETYPTSTTKSAAKFPAYIINMQEQVVNQHLHFKPLHPYSLIMTLEGHGAAVNAIQILDGNIVSASGDRTVKIWDVLTGACTRTFQGHSKGIACVQFDGRRIVSGSSDESVRIFDRVTGAEVACLQGHSNLVRTVQAQFGDLPGNEEELEAEARAVDRDFFEAQSRGLISQKLDRSQRRARNAGSRDPKAIFAYGAKLPPGGGGSKWARIVSGSYDETVIIWKKGADGAWEKSKTLFQNDAVTAAGGRPRRPAVQAQPNPNAEHPAQNNPQQQTNAQHNNFHALAQQAHIQAQAAQTLAQQAQALHAATQGMNGATVNRPPAQNQIQPANAPNATAHPPAPVQQPTQQQQLNAAVAAAAAPHHHHHHHPPHPPHTLANALNNQGTNSRVFKLQFDARRIICCSQDPTIVGWDFANGDRDVMVASQFFGDSY